MIIQTKSGKWRILASSWNLSGNWGILLVHYDALVGYFSSKLDFWQFLSTSARTSSERGRGEKVLFTFTALSYVISLCLRDPHPNGTTRECKDKDLSAQHNLPCWCSDTLCNCWCDAVNRYNRDKILGFCNLHWICLCVNK